MIKYVQTFLFSTFIVISFYFSKLNIRVDCWNNLNISVLVWLYITPIIKL